MSLYFDSAATTPPSQLAIDVFEGVSQNTWGNPSSTMYDPGIEAKRLLNEAREIVAGQMDCEPEQIIFTSGSTEGANMIMQGFIPRGYERSSKILLTQLEHPCVFNTAVYLQTCGAGVSFIKNTRHGRVLYDSLEEELEQAKDFRRVLVCCMAANNEIGSRTCLELVYRKVKDYPNAKLFSDLTQAMGDPDPIKCQFDYAVASAHKFGGLKGVGFAYVRDPENLPSLLHGGHQESGLRAGTENVAAIYSMARQLEEYRAEAKDLEYYMCRLNGYLRGALSAIGGRVNTPEEGLKNIVSVTFEGANAQRIIAFLAMKDICLSAGAACSANGSEYSRVLKACKMTEEEMAGTFRISLSPGITTQNIDTLIAAIKEGLSW